MSSGDGRDGNGTCAADVEEKWSFLVGIESARPDVVQTTGYTGQLQIHVATPVTAVNLSIYQLIDPVLFISWR